jgi:hypothetical protein
MQMKQRHVIWDWNGTLLDDYEITARIAIDSLEHLGRTGLTAQDIRHHHRRPLSDAFSNLLGRTVSDSELRLIGERYKSIYEPVMFDLPLAGDATRRSRSSRCMHRNRYCPWRRTSRSWRSSATTGLMPVSFWLRAAVMQDIITSGTASSRK